MAGRGSRLKRAALRALLALATLASLAGVHSYGVYSTPLMLMPLWFAARADTRAWSPFWFVVALPCALLTGMLWGPAYGLEGKVVARAGGISVWIAFALSAVVLRRD